MTTVTSGLRSIKGRIRRLIDRPLEAGPEPVSVPIDRCRHYNGYKYGSWSFNPYENYIVGMHQDVDRGVLRNRFEDFLRYFRPRHFGELLQVPLSNQVPMWVYPWNAGALILPNGGWHDDVNSVPDIITHFCEAGIQRSKIDGEYVWLEEAYNTIMTMGYQPGRFSYINVFEIRDHDESVFVVRDGNHRLGSLVACGHTHVIVTRDPRDTIDVSQHPRWPHVVSGLYSPAEARALCRRYFQGVDGFPRASVPAAILNT